MSEQLRDRALTQDIQEVLAEHPVLASVPLTVEVRGFIAHIRGLAASVEERRLAAKVVRRVRGVCAVWDLIEVKERRPDRVLDIGCGHTKQLSPSLGLDRDQFPPVDVIADLDCGLPFCDDIFDQVFAVHILEHIRDLASLMNEIHRVLRPGGVLHVIVPRWDHINAVADPTHLRLFHVQTFKPFCTDKPRTQRFRPLLVAAGADVVVADLEPVKSGEPPPTALELAHYFD